MPLDFRETVKRWMNYGEDYLKEARILYMKIIIQFIVLSTFVLGFIIVWVQIKGLINLSLAEKVILISVILLQIISITLGAWTLIEGNKFLNKAGENYQIKSIKLAKYILDTKKDSEDTYPEYLWEESKEEYSANPWQHIVQIVGFVLGIILLAILIILITF